MANHALRPCRVLFLTSDRELLNIEAKTRVNWLDIDEVEADVATALEHAKVTAEANGYGDRWPEIADGFLQILVVNRARGEIVIAKPMPTRTVLNPTRA